MRYVMQLLIIICFSFAGEILHSIIPLPFPASIYGIILLFISLKLKIVKVRHIREVSTTLIMAMPVMFVPAAVGLISTWENVQNHWWQYIIITVLSTLVVMAVSGWLTQYVIRHKAGKRSKDTNTQKN